MIGPRLKNVIISIVTTVWAINFFAPFVVESYNPSESINGIFMAIVGGLFALGARKNASGNGEGSSTKRIERPKDEKSTTDTEDGGEA